MGNNGSTSVISYDVACSLLNHSDDVIGAIEERFHVVNDVHLKNGISENTFRQLILVQRYPDIPVKVAHAIFKGFTKNEFIDMQEFLCGIAVMARGESEQRLSFAFRSFATTTEGKLTRDVLLRFDELLRPTCLYKDEGQWSSLAAVEELFGPAVEIDLDHFVQWGKQYMSSPLIQWVQVIGESVLMSILEPLDTTRHQFQHTLRRSSSQYIEEKARARYGFSPLSPQFKKDPRNYSEGDQVRKVYKQPASFIIGEDWFVISSDWFTKWSEYAGFAETPNNRYPIRRPGPINNSTLTLEDSDASTVRLRRDVYYQDHYFVINAATWSLLHKWYGGEPCIKRKVILSPDSNLPDLEIYPIELYLLNPLPSLVLVSRRDKIGVLLRGKQSKIWRLRGTKIEQLENDAEIQACAFSDGDAVVQATDEPSKSSFTFEAEISDKIEAKEGKTEDKSDKNEDKRIQGVRGLQNVGNSCYMNAAIQCLAHTSPFKYYFLSGAYINDINRTKRPGTIQGTSFQLRHIYCKLLCRQLS